MFKRSFFHGLTAGVLSAVAAIIYNRIYFFATEADFSRIINTGSLIGGSLMICLIAAFLHYGLTAWLKGKGEIVFNLVVFAGVFCLRDDSHLNFPAFKYKNAGIFPGLAVPMVLFPAMTWYTVKPLFR